MKWKMCHISV